MWSAKATCLDRESSLISPISNSSVCVKLDDLCLIMPSNVIVPRCVRAPWLVLMVNGLKECFRTGCGTMQRMWWCFDSTTHVSSNVLRCLSFEGRSSLDQVIWRSQTYCLRIFMIRYAGEVASLSIRLS